MSQQNLIATFSLETTQYSMAIAFEADRVIEATFCTSTISPVPGSIDFLAGVINLRGRIIPVINLKKRLHLDTDEYNPDASIIIVADKQKQYGLLVDTVFDVQQIDQQNIVDIPAEVRTDDKIIQSIIKTTDSRQIIEFLHLDFLFSTESFTEIAEYADNDNAIADNTAEAQQINNRQYIIVAIANREYALQTDIIQEIILPQEINTTFASGVTLGTIEFRNQSLLLISSAIISKKNENSTYSDQNQLIIKGEAGMFAMPVERTVEMITIAAGDIIPSPASVDAGFIGIYQGAGERNVMLIDVDQIVDQYNLSLYRSSQTTNQQDAEKKQARNTHIMSDNSYLIFTVNRRFAVQIKNIQEIITYHSLLSVPGEQFQWEGLLNLRGNIIPVISLRNFYGFEQNPAIYGQKIIIIHYQDQTAGLIVDDINTILKEPELYPIPTLNQQLAARSDTLYNIIKSINEDNTQDKILVINAEAIFNNYL